MINQIDQSVTGERLDVYFKNLFNFQSRSQIQKIIKKGKVIVNGKPENASYNLKTGDVISFDEEAFKEESTKGDLSDVIPENIPLDKVYEDQDLLVIDKPTGLVVHPGAGNRTGTVVNALANIFKDSFEKDSRYGLIHRIDKDTSGLLLIAKNENALNYYSSLFEKREVKKTYLCVVNAGITKLFNKFGKLKIEGYIRRSSSDRKRMQFQKTPDKIGRYSLTEFELEKYNSKFALIFAKPETGRTHQIRVHLKSIGYPIIGDTIYKGEKGSRLMLHAYKIELKLLNGKNAVFISNIPEEFISIAN